MATPRSQTGERVHAGEAGFTLLELLVTLTIAGLLIAIAAPRMADSVSRARLHATAERIASALRDLRAQAQQQDQPAVFAIDAGGQSFTAAGRQTTLPSGEKLAFRPFTRPSADQPTTPVLQFLPGGGASGGTIEVSNGKIRVEIRVDWLTGRASVGD